MARYLAAALLPPCSARQTGAFHCGPLGTLEPLASFVTGLIRCKRSQGEGKRLEMRLHLLEKSIDLGWFRNG